MRLPSALRAGAGDRRPVPEREHHRMPPRHAGRRRTAERGGVRRLSPIALLMSGGRLSARALAIVLAGLLASPGCSMMFSKPPRSHAGPDLDCSESRLPAIADSTVGSASSIVALIALI